MLPPVIWSMLIALDVQVGHFAGVALDELASRLHRVAHQHREDLVGAGGVVDRHLLERAVLGVHRGLEELVGVHLAQALEALHGHALAGYLQHLCAQLLERERFGLLLRATTPNGGVPARASSSPCTFTKPRYSAVENISRLRR